MKAAAYPPDRNPAGQIMNMSSPPRTMVTVSTCCTVAVKDGDAMSNRDGLVIRMKISRDHALRRNIPGYFKPRYRIGGSRKKILSGLLLLSRMAIGKQSGLDRMELRKMMRCAMESLMDEYLENVGLLNPLALGLPAFAMAGSGISKLRPENNPARMLAVMSRTTNGIFIASRLPVRPDCTPMSNPRYLLYVPS
jgi:hypothetical protein